MRDMFDDFMKELRRRQAELEARSGTEAGPEDGPGAASEESPAEEQANPAAASEQESDVTNGPDTDDNGLPEEDRPIFGRGGRRGGPTWRGPSDEFPEFHVGRGWVIAGIVVVGLLVIAALFTASIGLITDAIWFNSVGFASVFWTRIAAQLLYFAAGFLIAFLFLWLNIWLVGRTMPKGPLRRFSIDDLLERFNIDRYAGGLGGGPFGMPQQRRRVVHGGEGAAVPNISRPVFWILLAIVVFLALGLGGLMATSWTTIQLFIHRAPFGQTDPTFGLDISFFLFELPFYQLLQSYANSLLLMTLILVGVRYVVGYVSGGSMPTPARVHLGLLAMLYLWSIAIGYQLDRYSLVYSQTNGIFQGVGFTDANARMLAINVMTAIVLFVGAMVAYLAYARSATPLVLMVSLWLGAYFVLEAGYPFLVQRFTVDPNTQSQESPYIKDNIDMTRLAFNLDGWSGSSYTPAATITQQAVANEPGTIQNVRLWDASPLQATLDQVQVIRNYYNFGSVDTDRYTFTDTASCAPATPPCVRQVMLAGRELDPTQFSDSWVNAHITYTHGVGLAMTPVNEVATNGQPNLLVQNLPPISQPGVPQITQPRIYFGLEENGYVIVNASSPEFDYPSSSGTGGDQYTSWTAQTGIKLDTPLMRLLYAARFGDLNMLISNQITGSSQLLYNRSIFDRVQAIAPFLRYDKDPYLVVTSDGQLVYMLDAYTTSSAFPDAEPFDPGQTASQSGLAGGAFNYIRNSVKVVMNAYDGSLSFYVAYPSDPIIQAWQGVFPDLFKPLSEMPQDLQAHIRYPQDMFNAQTTQFARYHVTDPGVFYQGNDAWQVPSNSGSSGGPDQLALESFYVEMRVPGQTNQSFMLLQPMVPNGRKNMIAWVAAYNDYPSTYGKVSVFDFPRDSNVLGPVQMESLIQQTPEISQQITLWEGAGSHVVLGNLLVIPLQDTLMYVEPVYLQSQNSPLPVFQKVVVGTPTQIVWGNTLASALNAIYAGQGVNPGGGGGGNTPGASPTPALPTPTISPTAPGTPTPQPSVAFTGNAQELIAEANYYYQQAQQALANKDLATYQKDMDIVGQILTQLQNQLGTPAPSGQ
jgi:uncharacterized membrane protein (UPF0182 family)